MAPGTPFPQPQAPAQPAQEYAGHCPNCRDGNVPAGAQAVPSGSAKGQDHVWESLGNGDGYRYRVPGGWLYTLNCAKDEDGPDRPVFVPEPRQ